MYIVLSDNISDRKYSDFKKSTTTKYDSSSVPLITSNELEKIVLEYLEDKSIGETLR